MICLTRVSTDLDLRQRSRMTWALLIALLLLPAGCVDVEYMAYHGVQAWPTGSHFIFEVEGVPVIEGLPDRPYEVLGLIDVYHDRPFWRHRDAKKKVLKLVEEKGADALVWLSNRVVASGSLRMGPHSGGPAEIDTGRSTQPELIITQISRYTATSVRRVLRSTLLAIKWKSPG